MKKFYITTPIYYVNDEPHIGHAYTTILADVLSRYHRWLGDQTFFLTGTDEHGQKVAQAARERGVEPRQHCDETVVRFQELWRKLHISNDYFIRTTDENHKRVVQSILQKIYDSGDIYFDEYGGYYCVGCERFYTEKELDEGGRCPQHQKELSVIAEKNYFFRMSKYQQRLIDYIHDHPEFIQPEFRKNEVLGFLRQPLGDLCISRPKSRLSWGIEIPFDSDYVTYVWFDALINYVTAVGAVNHEERFEKWWPADYHLVGKDILTTHAVYWPTMLFAADIPQPKTIFAHGWWLSNDFKMSKSLGNVVRPLDLIEEFGVDPVRYFLMRDMVLGQDASFSVDAFVRRYNSDLANDLGNLVGRITTLIQRHFGGRIPQAGAAGQFELELSERGGRMGETVKDLILRMKANGAVEDILQFIRSINRYMERREPWKLAKTDKDQAGTVLYHAAEGLRIGLLLLSPIMPVRTARILHMLGASADDNSGTSWGGLKPGSRLGEFELPFPRIEFEEKKDISKKDKTDEEKQMTDGTISIDDFAKVELKTAQVLRAEKVEGADKLLKIQIKIGDEERQIVAGIAQHYAAQDLEDKIIIVVTNLQPAKIRGVESNGMLLAASSDDAIVLVTVDNPSVGSGVRIS